MEQQQRSLLFTASVGLIILAIIVASIYYLVKFIQGRVSSSRQPVASVETIKTDSAAPEIINIEENPSAAGAPTPGTAASRPTTQPRSAINIPAGRKLYNPGTFQVYYPQNWGMLKCTNSANFEFDPSTGVDSSVGCETAVKPITVLVDDIKGCDGENLRMGNVEVMKSRNVDDEYISYRWCTKTDPVLNITHRVSKNGERATSTNDFSTQIEDLISKITFVRGS